MGHGTSELQQWIDRLQEGDSAARDRLLECAQDRLGMLARKMLRGFPGVQRWEGVEDVIQQAQLRLWRALQDIAPGTVREFVGLAALQVRRALIDLARPHFGPEGIGRTLQTPVPGETSPEPRDTSADVVRLAAWSEFHEKIDGLPEKEREVFELHWYQGLTHGDTAEALNVSVDTVKRRWQSARLLLYEALDGELPSS